MDVTNDIICVACVMCAWLCMVVYGGCAMLALCCRVSCCVHRITCSTAQQPSTPNRKPLPNGKRPSPLRRKLYYEEAPSVEQDESAGKEVPDTVGSASRRRKAAPARYVVWAGSRVCVS